MATLLPHIARTQSNTKAQFFLPSEPILPALVALGAIAVGCRHLSKAALTIPRGATENHVEYILVASFDIDRGPVMEHQYPVAITGDENMLAELMLPDQAHARNQDWTIFFLHKESNEEEEEKERQAKEERRRRRRRRRNKLAGIIDEEDEDDLDGDKDDDVDEDLDDNDDESTDSEPEGGEGPR
ncbi:hypothetical protein V2G26_013558 [Clonostachys chloroleuca]